MNWKKGKCTVERKNGEVAMMLKLENNASKDLQKNIEKTHSCESYESRIPQKKDRGTETSEKFALLTEEIEKKMKAEKKVLELQMMMDENQKIDTAIEIKVLRNACEEEAKLRGDLEADGLEKKLQMEEFKMKLKVFIAEKADFSANMQRKSLHRKRRRISKQHTSTTYGED